MDQYVIGIDVGTGSARAGVFDRLVARAGVSIWILLAPAMASSSASWITRFSTMWPRAP